MEKKEEESKREMQELPVKVPIVIISTAPKGSTYLSLRHPLRGLAHVDLKEINFQSL